MRLVFDIEANGLLWDATAIHCIVTKDVDTGEVREFRPHQIDDGLKHLMAADLIVGHNVIGYDLPLLSKLHPWFAVSESRVQDTLILSRLIFADISDRDRKQRVLEGKEIGSHSLRAWGKRIGLHKGDYEGGWFSFNEDMLAYNRQDVEVTERLWNLLTEKLPSEKAALLEHQVAWICAEQERFGFQFDTPRAEQLTSVLQQRRAELEVELQATFKPFYQASGYVTPKRTMVRQGVLYTKDEPYTKVKLTTFNPGSRHHIADRLIKIRGWKPTEFTPDGHPKVDETVLSKLQWPEAKLLTEYLTVQKRLGQIAEGQNAWLNLVKNGRLHGEVITNGAVTGRATHRNPNIAQVPAVGALYGKECRSLFTVPKGYKLVGVDVSGLELRMLGHFMAKYDNGAYAKEVVEGDIHTANQKAAGLETRNQAKTFIYAFLYGAGPEKIGKIVGKGKAVGVQLRQRFLQGVPALSRLISAVQAAAKRGYLVGLDGRHLHIRSDHAALNTLLQSAGALICKQWMVEVEQELRARTWGDVHQVAWIHDEIQYQVPEELAEFFGQMAVECITRAANYFEIRVPLTGEFKIGSDWAETH